MIISDEGLDPTESLTIMDERGNRREMHVAVERPLTVYLDKREIVTLMTIGTYPEWLTLGYLRNQHLITDLNEVRSVQVDWSVDAVAVTTHAGNAGDNARLEKRTVTTGCGQGTVYGDLMEQVDQLQMQPCTIRQSALYAMLETLKPYNVIYRGAGAVHGCALCQGAEVVSFVEDVGRHNAVDAIAGDMWLRNIAGEDKYFYTTGRLTSEMVIKVAQMQIPLLVSRSGTTAMGLSIARQLGITLIGRTRGRRFMVYNGADNVILDEPLD